MRCKVFTFVLRNLAKVNYSVIEVNIGDASIFAGKKKANRLMTVEWIVIAWHHLQVYMSATVILNLT